ncbi:unnamed protein product [Pleuronectes platessa]|uniref:Uncharacterized protein n=1 Tax=Pleuronectes platessa TaxID=8262 RepID=A0A9N7Z8G0_PLEPL|nr:unnamed protein product [Pleuronectes platessa]
MKVPVSGRHLLPERNQVQEPGPGTRSRNQESSGPRLAATHTAACHNVDAKRRNDEVAQTCTQLHEDTSVRMSSIFFGFAGRCKQSGARRFDARELLSSTFCSLSVRAEAVLQVGSERALDYYPSCRATRGGGAREEEVLERRRCGCRSLSC